MLSDRRSSSLIAGREQERARLRELLDDALAGHGSLVLVSGEAGIGKTTLVDDMAQQARERGALVLTGHCYDLTASRPFAPWLDALHTLQSDRSPVALLAHDRPAGTPHGPDVLFEQIADSIAMSTRERPLIITLEDMHWSDHSSLEALRYLARQTAALALLLVVTYRDEEIDPRHLLYKLLPALVREASAERIELRRLSEEAMHEWISGRYPLSPRDQERLVSHLQANAEGNPFFTVEMLRTLESDGILRATLAGWVVGRLESLGMPLLLRQVIDARLAMLDHEDRELLAVGAVIGHQAPLDIWSEVVGVDEDRLIDLVEAAVNANLLVAAADGRSVVFSHALIRAALYEAILPPRRRVWHQRIAEALVDSDSADPDLLAHHLHQASDPRAPRWLIRAADRAYHAYAFSSAIERYEAALELTGETDLDPSERGWTLLHLAQSFRYIDSRQALAHATEAREIAAAIGDPVLIALTAWSRGQIRGLLGEHSLAELRAAYDQLMTLPERDRERVWEAERLNPDLLTSAFVRWLALYGHYEEALAIGEAHLAAMPESEEDWAGLGIAYTALGRPDDARQAFQRAFDYYQRHAMRQLAQVMTFTSLTWVTLIYKPDQIAERQRLAREAQDTWERSAGIRLDLDPQAVWAPLLLIEGRWDEAQHYATQMISPAFRTSGLCWLGQLARFRGDWDAAWERVREMLPDGPAGDPALAGRPAFISMIVLVNLAANLALDQADLELAGRWIETHERWLAWSGAILGRPENRLLRARFHQLDGDLATATEYARAALELAGEPRQPLAQLAAHRLLGELDTAARRYASAASHLDESLALAEACAAPYERALTLLARAGLLVALSKPDEARDLIEGARAICVPLRAGPALEQARALEERLATRPRSAGQIAGLTGRELEVLRLVARGLTDAEAGEQLFISPRTVSQHLRSVYNKLGVSSRAAAVAFAFEHNLI